MYLGVFHKKICIMYVLGRILIIIFYNPGLLKLKSAEFVWFNKTKIGVVYKNVPMPQKFTLFVDNPQLYSLRDIILYVCIVWNLAIFCFIIHGEINVVHNQESNWKIKHVMCFYQ